MRIREKDVKLHTHTHTYANIHTPDTDINYHRVNVQVVRLQSVCVQLFICLGTSQNAQMFVCNCKCQSSHVFQNELSTGSKHKKFKPFTPVTVQAGFEQDFFALYHCIVFEGSKLHHN